MHRLSTFTLFAFLSSIAAIAGPSNSWTVLPGIQHGNMTIYPVVGGSERHTQRFLTLDAGIQNGSVIIKEVGSGGEVNRLSLINNSDRPLLLLAGEIVTGGKQDRIVGSDRIVPAHSAPVDLSVFCVEPGRWTSESDHFKTLTSQMASPSVRAPAMAAKNQQQVWNETRAAVSQSVEVASAGHAGGLAAPPPGTSSYAKAMGSPAIQAQVTEIVQDFNSDLRRLRNTHAKGMVVAINGRILWADVFASEELFQRYWEKLIRSYASDALLSGGRVNDNDRYAAQRFLDELGGVRETSETKPSLFQSTEATGEGYKVFTLTSLLPDTGYTVHTAKIARGEARVQVGRMLRR